MSNEIPEVPKEGDLKAFSEKLSGEQLDVIESMMKDSQNYISASTMQMSMYGAMLKNNSALKPSEQVCEEVKDLSTYGKETIHEMTRMAEVVRRADGGTATALKANLEANARDASQMQQGLDESLKVPQQACKAAFPKMGM